MGTARKAHCHFCVLKPCCPCYFVLMHNGIAFKYMLFYFIRKTVQKHRAIWKFVLLYKSSSGPVVRAHSIAFDFVLAVAPRQFATIPW
jgi:hypothetical protein